jgi:hypothetical protein
MVMAYLSHKVANWSISIAVLTKTETEKENEKNKTNKKMIKHKVKPMTSYRKKSE